MIPEQIESVPDTSVFQDWQLVVSWIFKSNNVIGIETNVSGLFSAVKRNFAEYKSQISCDDEIL